MSDSLLAQPKSTSLLQPTKFKMTFMRVPDVVYFLQKFQLPGGTLPPVTQYMPFKNRPAAGNKLDYETLKVTFIVEEDMYSWAQIHNWIKSLGTETGFSDYQQLKKMPGGEIGFSAYSDATLTVLSTQNNPKIQFKFYDTFPITLGTIEFDSSKSAEEVYHVDVEFGFHYYESIRMQNV